MGCGAQDLPQELTDHVISFLADDTASLSSCSLACKSWSAESTKLLFHTLLVESDDVEDFLSFVDQLRIDRVRGNIRRLHLGCDLYVKAASEECCCERDIRRIQEHQPGIYRDLCPSYRTWVSAEKLLTALSLLPRLESVTLLRVVIESVTNPESLKIFRSMKLRLDSLILVDTWDVETFPGYLKELLSGFYSIRDFKSFSHPHLPITPGGGDTTSLRPDYPREVQSLSITSICIVGFCMAVIAGVQSLYTPHDLKQLDLAPYLDNCEDDLQILCRFIEQSTALEDLRLRLPFRRWEVERTPEFPAHLVLHELNDSTADSPEPLLPTHPDPNGVWTGVVAMLDSASPNIRDIYIHAKLLDWNWKRPSARSVRFDSYDWATLGHTLATFTNLEQIQVVPDVFKEQECIMQARALSWTKIKAGVTRELARVARAARGARLALDCGIQGLSRHCVDHGVVHGSCNSLKVEDLSLPGPYNRD
ncbi:hypothetical protein PHLGIDRAFT_16809 [Phlebiopsis gigantea 11061_1 CR5-6]|uniref:F-box domain-containing protein n=1 Tax=Phlebiopsis gigantea (strain 11061_1 CR5-6) TaxID=745531 RepID=A0A0C3NC27_PHLG1|nr:hypothetical protein PHLGIDRAFT_16809 [Phlebiopsis gigantea 11061_1 CR5-6]